MRRARIGMVLSLVGLCVGCGSSSELEGVSLGEIRLEGDHAEDVVADLADALTRAGAMLHQTGQPDLVGTLTWEWAGEGDTPYPTLVKVFLQTEPEEGGFTVMAQYRVAQGAQPQDVAHYRSQIVERIVERIAARSRSAS